METVSFLKLLIFDEAIGFSDGADAVFGVGVGADFFRVFGRDDGAAGHEPDVRTFFFQKFHGGLHFGKGRRHEGAEADDVRLLRLRVLQQVCRVDVFSEIGDFVAAVFQKGGDDIFAQVVDVALDGADGEAAFRRGGDVREEFLSAAEAACIASAAIMTCGRKYWPRP